MSNATVSRAPRCELLIPRNKVARCPFRIVTIPRLAVPRDAKRSAQTVYSIIRYRGERRALLIIEPRVYHLNQLG